VTTYWCCDSSMNIEIMYLSFGQMEFSFGADRWIPDVEEKSEQSFALGLHVPGFFDKVLDVDKCLLQSEAANKVIVCRFI
jgi:hypothetical protein